MHIGIDCRSLCEPYPSGVSHYTGELLRALFALPESREHQWVLFANGWQFRQNDARKHLFSQLDVSIPNVIWRITHWPSKMFTAATLAMPRLHPSRITGAVDVMFLPNMDFFPIARTVPTVLTIHDCSLEYYPEFFSAKAQWRHRLLSARRYLHHISHVIAVSHHTKKDVMGYYHIPSEHISLIYPGSNGQLPADNASLPAHLPSRYIMVLGTQEPRKNIATAIAAFQQIAMAFPDVHLVIAGAGYGKDGNNHTVTTILPAFRKRVHFLGYLAEAQKWALLKNSMMLLYPSFYEGFGFPPLEAQRVGVPVIAGAHSSLVEVIGNSGLLVDVQDTAAVARALELLLADEHLRIQMRARGFINVARFSWQGAAKQTLDVLRNLR